MSPRGGCGAAGRAGVGAARSARQRGSALPALLLVLVLLEGAILAAASQVHRLSWRYDLERSATAAERLAESGLSHAIARLAADPSFRGEVSGRLAEGRYSATVLSLPDGAIDVSSTGTAAGRRSIRLRQRVVVEGNGFRVLAATRQHFVER